MTAVLNQVESCLNSRPLVPMTTTDGEGVEALTPAHFLIGKPMCALPEKEFPLLNPTLFKKWYLCQHLVKSFWRRWSTEYLTSLRKFYKWHHPIRNLTPGDVVIIKDEDTPTGWWPIGRIVEVYPGKDGLVRVAKIKTSKLIYKRPIAKLVHLFFMTTVRRQDVFGGAGCLSEMSRSQDR